MRRLIGPPIAQRRAGGPTNRKPSASRAWVRGNRPPAQPIRRPATLPPNFRGRRLLPPAPEGAASAGAARAEWAAAPRVVVSAPRDCAAWPSVQTSVQAASRAADRWAGAVAIRRVAPELQAPAPENDARMCKRLPCPACDRRAGSSCHIEDMRRFPTWQPIPMTQRQTSPAKSRLTARAFRSLRYRPA